MLFVKDNFGRSQKVLVQGEVLALIDRGLCAFAVQTSKIVVDYFRNPSKIPNDILQKKYDICLLV